jgi:hypothetical protein
MVIDAHGLKIQGRGYLKFFLKSLGGQGFQEKLPRGSSYFGFYCIFINNLEGGPIFTLPLPPSPTFVHLWLW